MDENAQSFSHFYGQPESPKIYLPKPANSSSSGLTLVIPSLKSLKASQSANKSKHRSTSQAANAFHDADLQEKRAPRPVKLKPLKEVLSKLIAQLKKKDDYAFFLHPVDVANVPGYSDIVKRPMDLGTMSDKVSKGKYRSLEDFASDFRLVTNNAKMFNPPGTIYHTEADRLEVWGLDHISKASSTVIQYETDWNIEIEKDDDGAPVNVDEDDEENNNESTAMDVDGTSMRGERSVSVASQVQPGPSRRGPRGPYKKQGQNGPGNTLSESLETDGGLPGSKDGLGSFPAGSDWAKTMVALKLKGKRYKTKKERMRIEREGPPLLADGSLDYTEMEDPFSVLSFFVPDPPSRPHLVPLYPPLYNSATATATVPAPPQSQLQSQSYPPQTPQQQTVNFLEPSSSQIHTPQSQLPTGTGTPVSYNPSSSAGASSAFAPFPAPTAVPLEHTPLTLPFIAQTQNRNDSSGNGNNANGTGTGKQKQQHQQQPRRRHWTILRNTTSRQKGKEREDHEYLPYGQYGQLGQGQVLFDAAGRPIKGNELPGWQMPREAHALDFGSLSVLAGALAEEMRKPGIIAATPSTSTNVTSTSSAGADETQAQVQGQPRDKEQDVVFDLIRDSLDCESALKKMKDGEDEGVSVQTNGISSSLLAGGYWTDKRAAEAEEYVRDLVYGGVDGLAYVRSLAEFVDGKTYLDDEDEDIGRERELGVNPEHEFNPALGKPLAKWVEANIVDPLTEGRHSLLRETALELARQHNRHHPSAKAIAPSANLKDDPRQGTVAGQVAASLRLYPAALVAMSALMHIRMHKIDMGSLIKTPNELFLSEEEWIGKVLKEQRREKAKAKLVAPEGTKTREGQGSGGEKDGDAMEVEEPEQTWAGVDASLVKDRVNGRLPAYEQEGPEELNEVLEYVADVIVELDAQTKEKKDARKAATSATAAGADDMQVNSPTKAETEADPQMPPAPPPSPAEDPAIRNLRLNLLALAKRAPLDTIARLPKDLVPEHIRHFVPTLGSTG